MCQFIKAYTSFFQPSPYLHLYASLYLEVHGKGVNHSQLRTQVDLKVFAVDSKVTRIIRTRFCGRAAEETATGGVRAVNRPGAFGEGGILDTSAACVLDIVLF